MPRQAERYVVVEPESKLIVGGPYMWDGRAKWVAPEIAAANEPDSLAVMLESEAFESGYSVPVPEPTED